MKINGLSFKSSFRHTDKSIGIESVSFQNCIVQFYKQLTLLDREQKVLNYNMMYLKIHYVHVVRKLTLIIIIYHIKIVEIYC